MFFRLKRAVPYEKWLDLPLFSALFRSFPSVRVSGDPAAWRGVLFAAEMKKAANS
ncbi:MULTISPECIES: hypothetical protein [Janthinobacterium]|uniref:Uncharacterized protein n=1 Tax=Janthinobacterium rivuli TaxID=2751478 RepID=A0ABY8I9Y3_9BURK|nr:MULTISPECIES: hypothetical protein [Janthinobacterium]MBW3512591.1 hypothetical protein [Janthinobacterium sp. NKUCC06_STL]WFR81754.1 hypothetical protein P9875_11600 [Janthinobacterium rivuli]